MSWQDEDAVPRDTDGDGIIDALDIDDDNDGICSEYEGIGDQDGDGQPNFLDLNSDGDALPDSEEGRVDFDCDGLPRFLDTNDTDRLREGSCCYMIWPAGIMNCNGPGADTNGNGIMDTLEGLPPPPPPSCDVAPGSSK